MIKNRTTKQKQLIIKVAQAHYDHPTADEIYLEVRALDNHISRGTVYRNLEQLSKQGELLHVKLHGADRYDGRTDNHYHIICTECGAVCDAPIEYKNEIDTQVISDSGFKAIKHRIIFEGLCPKCSKNDEDKVKTL